MTSQLTFTNGDGTHVIKYLVTADSPPAFSAVLTGLLHDIAVRLGPSVAMENQPLDYVL